MAVFPRQGLGCIETVLQWWENMGIEDDAVILQFKSTLSCENWTALFRGVIKQKE